MFHTLSNAFVRSPYSQWVTLKRSTDKRQKPGIIIILFTFKLNILMEYNNCGNFTMRNLSPFLIKAIFLIKTALILQQ